MYRNQSRVAIYGLCITLNTFIISNTCYAFECLAQNTVFENKSGRKIRIKYGFSEKLCVKEVFDSNGRCVNDGDATYLAGYIEEEYGTPRKVILASSGVFRMYGNDRAFSAEEPLLQNIRFQWSAKFVVRNGFFTADLQNYRSPKDHGQRNA